VLFWILDADISPHLVSTLFRRVSRAGNPWLLYSSPGFNSFQESFKGGKPLASMLLTAIVRISQKRKSKVSCVHPPSVIIMQA